MEQQDLLSNELSINEGSQANLLAAAKWGKFLAIVGFIFCGLMIIGALGIYISGNSGNSALRYYSHTEYLAAVYFVLGILLFFPCLYLNRFSVKMQQALRLQNQESMDKAFVNLKAMFKFYGILTIVILGFYALVLIFGIGTGMFR